MNPSLTVDDKHQISSLVIDTSQPVNYHNPGVGLYGITGIEAYNEFGQGEYGLWFAISVGEDTIWRVNGRYVVEVSYGK
jgi:hypothetical protein